MLWSAGHEVYRQWVALVDATNEKDHGVQVGPPTAC
jgi:hypothetical protein